ncbi:sugar phosphate isomerase/epimerase [Nocardioides sp. JQ2195]|uniref:sugar phosphate isomerase/epimerase family protein n=1 Tax=Nocardioides sp. JQ2195 TaxID=2592334 RepID=UPI00143E7322|nr:sugar phosphate isomerase/epimerase [Nocardioides sp. JQ2195]QIX26492.1 sugar phosphate isomerase/epimerase [Nocardioides sp. JQ2195]
MTFTSSSSLGRDDLVLCAGTVLGTDFLTRVEVAAATGYRGVTLRVGECGAALASGAAEMLRVLDEHDVEIAELDGITDWAGHHDEDRSRFDPMWSVVEEVGVRALNVMEMGTAQMPVEAYAEGFASLCDRAADSGTLVGLEPLPWTGIPDLARAADIVRAAGRPNGGLTVDTWHLFRAGHGVAELTAVLDLVIGIQVNDAPTAPMSDLLVETQHHRLLPGRGDAAVANTLRVLRDAGIDAPLGVEVMSDALAAMTPIAAAALAAEAAREVSGP